jgi:hypothetical protein
LVSVVPRLTLSTMRGDTRRPEAPSMKALRTPRDASVGPTGKAKAKASREKAAVRKMRTRARLGPVVVFFEASGDVDAKTRSSAFCAVLVLGL